MTDQLTYPETTPQLSRSQIGKARSAQGPTVFPTHLLTDAGSCGDDCCEEEQGQEVVGIHLRCQRFTNLGG